MSAQDTAALVVEPEGEYQQMIEFAELVLGSAVVINTSGTDRFP